MRRRRDQSKHAMLPRFLTTNSLRPARSDRAVLLTPTRPRTSTPCMRSLIFIHTEDGATVGTEEIMQTNEYWPHAPINRPLIFGGGCRARDPSQ